MNLGSFGFSSSSSKHPSEGHDDFDIEDLGLFSDENMKLAEFLQQTNKNLSPSPEFSSLGSKKIYCRHIAEKGESRLEDVTSLYDKDNIFADFLNPDDALPNNPFDDYTASKVQNDLLKEVTWNEFTKIAEELYDAKEIRLNNLHDLYLKAHKFDNSAIYTEEEYEALQKANDFIIKQMYLLYSKDTENEKILIKLIHKTKRKYQELLPTDDAPVSEDTKDHLRFILKSIIKGLTTFPNLYDTHHPEIETMLIGLDYRDTEMNSEMSKPSTNPVHSINTVVFSELQAKSAEPLDIPGLPPVGFANTASNCWANSLLHLIWAVPAYLKAYTALADIFSRRNLIISQKLKNVLTEYDECLAEQWTVPKEVSQEFREAISLMSKGKISDNPRHQCDPHDALMVLLSTYQELANTTDSTIFCKLQKTKAYIPLSECEPCVSKNAYTMMPEGNLIKETEFCASLDFELPQTGKITFNELKDNYFNNPNAILSDSAFFQVNNETKQSFRLIEERQKLTTIPEQFLITLKRFGTSEDGRLVKIYTNPEMPLTFDLNPIETEENKKQTYELVSFIEHSGNYEGGHYVHYQKINDNQWIRLDDGHRTLRSKIQIESILSGNICPESTSYLHFYVKNGNACTEKLSLENGVATDLTELNPGETTEDFEPKKKKIKVSDYLL